MKRIILPIIFMCCFCFNSNAQEAAKKDAPEQTRIEVEAVNIQAQVTIAQSEIEKAEQALLVAKLVRQNMILKIRLLLKVPNDWVEKFDEKGNLFFVKPETKPKE